MHRLEQGLNFRMAKPESQSSMSKFESELGKTGLKSTCELE